MAAPMTKKGNTRAAFAQVSTTASTADVLINVLRDAMDEAPKGDALAALTVATRMVKQRTFIESERPGRPEIDDRKALEMILRLKQQGVKDAVNQVAEAFVAGESTKQRWRDKLRKEK
jgi:hypothetical protein